MPASVDYSMAVRAEQCEVIEAGFLAGLKGVQRSDVMHVDQSLPKHCHT